MPPSEMHLTHLLRSFAAITDSPGVFFQEELLRAYPDVSFL